MENEYTNVTKYLKSIGKYNKDIIRSFLKINRVKCFIGDEKMVIAKTGRYSEGTFLRNDLFDLFVSWMKKEPIPLLSRKEYNVRSFIETYYSDAIYQYKLDDFIFDWYLPSHNILVEFNEKTHNNKAIKRKDGLKIIETDKEVITINEKTYLKDLALLVKSFPSPQLKK